MSERGKSKAAFAAAQKYIPGGVNSPVRAFGAVGGDPVFISEASGSKLRDIDGTEYIDYVCSWGPLLHGHAHPDILTAVSKAAQRGTSFGAPTEGETELAEKICDMIPSIDKVRLVNSGTEATMSAVRLARGFTGRELIVKFRGCYHGHGDSFLIAAGSGAVTLGVPNSPGVTAGTARDTLLADFNDQDSVAALFKEHGDNIAAVIVEPVAGNMGVIPPLDDFLDFLRSITQTWESLLIFDEVMTGFRVARGGAQERYGILPDLTTLGKIIGGGLPVGAYGGKAEIMDRLSPDGPVYQAGTLSGNPIAVAAGLATLTLIDEIPELYSRLDTMGDRLAVGLEEAAERHGVPAVVNRVGSMMTCFFTEARRVASYSEAMSADKERYAKYFHEMLNRGIYSAPSQFEAAFVSSVHTIEDIDRTIAAADEALGILKG